MQELTALLGELKSQSLFKKDEMCVIRCSASEIIGEKIGSVSLMEAAEIAFNELERIKRETGVSFALQGCEHINRVITIEREDYNPFTMEEVAVIPNVHAGGSLVTYAYQYMNDPIVIEYIRVPKGIDIGQTPVGMYINHVCVPLRTSVKKVGEAIATVTISRPKRISGERAKYEQVLKEEGEYISHTKEQDHIIYEAI